MIIHCQERFDNARLLAEKNGQLESFNRCFDRLSQWENREHCPVRIHVYSDIEPHSFFFREEYLRPDLIGREGTCGGIIYHGAPKEGYRVASSIQITPSYGWSIHT